MPIRVVRGFGKQRKGFIYEGLFHVIDHKQEKSKDGQEICYCVFINLIYYIVQSFGYQVSFEKNQWGK